jgi:pimeloyl-ACP methyl ester carboxylesterase
MTTRRPRKRPSSTAPRATRRRSNAARAVVPLSGTAPDLTRGVIVVLSGGGFDLMNPKEVRDRMDQYIADVNADPYVQTTTAGAGLTFMILPGQKHPHLHQSHWRQICTALNQLNPTALVLVGHSNGGAAVMDLARCLSAQQRQVDLVFSADSVLTLDDIGDVNIVPANVRINVNTHVIPTPAWILAPFPFGKANRRLAGDPLDGILNVGLAYNLGGAIAHRNAFYDLAGGDKKGNGFKYPNTLLDTTLAVLRGATAFDIVQAVEAPLQTLATKAKVRIEMEATHVKKTLLP